jgi:hypothetical protein
MSVCGEHLSSELTYRSVFFNVINSLPTIVSKCVATEAVVQQWHGESVVGTLLNSVPHERTK